MLVLPNIKINLGLFVTGKRPDGFHNIESIFYPVPWCEALEVTPYREASEFDETVNTIIQKGNARLFLYGNEIPGQADNNLCLQVYERLQRWYNLPEVDIHLNKTLPIGAGLGGGSADATFTLKALKSYFDLTISDREAMDLLAELGSDCPFFWKNRPMFVYGRGEQMRPIELDLSGYYILLVNPGIHIPTKEAYAGITPKSPAVDLELMSSLPVEQWRDVLHNDFEDSIFPNHPAIAQIKTDLYSAGATYASMSGSGSTVYGIFNEPTDSISSFSHYTTWSGKLTF